MFGELNTDWYPDKFPCPRHGCDAKAEFMDAIDPRAMAVLLVYEMTPGEAYAAFHGLGLPAEKDCGPTAVKQLFGKMLVGGDIKLIKGSNRSVVHNLVFEDGTILYLASSPMGATAYRLSKPESAVERVDDEG